MFWSTIGRIIVVPLSFLLAAAAAGFVLVTLGLERATQSMAGRSESDSIGAIFDLVGQTHLLVSGLTILPALALVIVGEVARIRSAIYYVIGGGAALAVVPLLSRMGTADALAIPAPVVWQVFATAGFAGGFVYWVLAGRNA